MLIIVVSKKECIQKKKKKRLKKNVMTNQIDKQKEIEAKSFMQNLMLILINVIRLFICV